MLGNPVLLRFFRILELDSALLTAFLIRLSLVPGSIFCFESPFALPLVLNAVPLTILAREPVRLILSPLLVGRVQDGQSLRVSHITRLADSDRLATGAGVIWRQIDEIVSREVPQTKTATRALRFIAGADWTGSVAARS